MAKFRTQARAIDMLGRQQIAGIPTAISELFKNAHDAYAKHVEIDYFLSDDLFILGDDGIGMTKDDFETRWLTVGAQTRDETTIDELIDLKSLGLEKRPTMGEKGIGRLAISTLGPQVLVVSRAIRTSGLQDMVCSFMNWKIFECPNINLDEIEIPIITLPGESYPNKEQVKELVSDIEANLTSLKDRIPTEQFEDILKDLGEFSFDPNEFVDYIDQTKITGDGYGTQFFIYPTNENLRMGVEEYRGTGISKLRQLLLGFNNSFIPGAQSPRIQTAFRYWETKDHAEDLINTYEFFTPEEFSKADHQFLGNFDEYGRFRGAIKVYDETFEDQLIDCGNNRSIRTACGPFRINIAYLMGLPSESKMIPLDYQTLKDKMESGLAGLYIYRDGIRILPYGDSEVDFLRMEERRSKGAGYYFFSYRRIFGTIEITKEKNKNLIEKAGREGFQENKAYNEFRSILEKFFLRVTAEYFRETGSKSDSYREGQNYYKRLSAAMKKHGEETDAKRALFEEDLTKILNRIEDREPEIEIENILSRLRIATNEIIRDSQPEKFEELFLTRETQANNAINEIREKYLFEKPAQLGLSTEQNRLWTFYLEEMERLENECFLPGKKQVASIISSILNEVQVHVERRQRLLKLVEEIKTSTQTRIEEEVQATKESEENVRGNLESLFDAIRKEYKTILNQIESEIESKDVSNLSDEQIESLRIEMENRLLSEVSSAKDVLTNMRATLSQVNWEKDSEGNIIGQADWITAIESDWLAQREWYLADLEAAQLGKTIEIINHQFESTVKSIRDGLTRMKKWADRDQDLNNLYTIIRESFNHLDEYLKMFTPLQRRLYRTEMKIKGAFVEEYVKGVFSDKLLQNNIKMKVTDEFREYKLTTYPSTLYPVFVNIIDNAIFWVCDREQDRTILLDATDNAFLISNNGPKIPERDRQAIFDRGFSRKPGGTGLGLYISREILSREDLTLELLSSDQSEDTTFKISSTKPQEA